MNIYREAFNGRARLALETGNIITKNDQFYLFSTFQFPSFATK